MASSELKQDSPNIANQNQSGNTLSADYFQNQLILHILMKIPSDSFAHEKFVEMCCEQFNSEPNQLSHLVNFERQYSSDRALWWYFQDSFLHKILNYSLESLDINNLYICRKVLSDMEQQMERHRCTTPLHVYRSQLMPKHLLETWKCSIGQCIVINSFLSATTSFEIASAFLHSNTVRNENCERVLLEIDADSRITGSKPFFHSSSLKHIGDRNEVLFTFGSVFLINNIRRNSDGIYVIELTLYSDNDHELKAVFQDIKTKYDSKKANLLTVAQMMYEFGRFDDAETYAKNYLDELPGNHEDQLLCFNFLGSTNLAKNKFEQSLIWYKKELETRLQISSTSDDLKIADVHENIGDVYLKQNLYDQAVKQYEDSLNIRVKTLPAYHPLIGATLESIGRIYENMKNYREAFSFLQKAKAVYSRMTPKMNDKLAQINEHIQNLTPHLH